MLVNVVNVNLNGKHLLTQVKTNRGKGYQIETLSTLGVRMYLIQAVLLLAVI